MYLTHTDYILQLGQDHVYIYNAKYVTSKHENTQPLPLVAMGDAREGTFVFTIVILQHLLVC